MSASWPALVASEGVGSRACYERQKKCSGLSASSETVSNGITELASILNASATTSTQMGLGVGRRITTEQKSSERRRRRRGSKSTKPQKFKPKEKCDIVPRAASDWPCEGSARASW